MIVTWSPWSGLFWNLLIGPQAEGKNVSWKQLVTKRDSGRTFVVLPLLTGNYAYLLAGKLRPAEDCKESQSSYPGYKSTPHQFFYIKWIFSEVAFWFNDFFWINTLFFRAILGWQKNWADSTEFSYFPPPSFPYYYFLALLWYIYYNWWVNVGTLLLTKVHSLH